MKRLLKLSRPKKKKRTLVVEEQRPETVSSVVDYNQADIQADEEAKRLEESEKERQRWRERPDEFKGISLGSAGEFTDSLFDRYQMIR